MLHLIKMYSSWAPKKIFIFSIIVTTLIRLLIAYFLPLTGDEIYYAVWGLRGLDWGYYDHPPGVALLFSLSFLLGNNFWTARFFGISVPVFVSFLVLYFLKKNTTSEKAYLWASLLNWIPLFLFGIIVSPDTLLVPMVFLSTLFFWRAFEENNKFLAVLSGLFLGAAFLSKLLILPYIVFLIVAVFFVSSGQKTKYLQNLILKFLFSLPFVFMWGWWNAHHCWTHYMLNVVNRHGNGEWGVKNLFNFLFYQFLIFTPILLYYLVKNHKKLVHEFQTQKKLRWVFVLGFGSMLSFGVSALRFPPSLHWPMPYNLILFALIGLIFSLQEIKKILKGMVLLSLLITVIAVGVLSQADRILPHHSNGKTLHIFFHREEFSRYLKEYQAQGYFMASDSYTLSSLFEYQSYKENWPSVFAVLGGTTFFGRQDDLSVDYKTLAGRNFVIFSRGETGHEKYGDWFREIRVHPIKVRGWTYSIIEGIDFQYEHYNKTVLQKLIHQHYRFPDFLPVKACPIIDRNF